MFVSAVFRFSLKKCTFFPSLHWLVGCHISAKFRIQAGISIFYQLTSLISSIHLVDVFYWSASLEDIWHVLTKQRAKTGQTISITQLIPHVHVHDRVHDSISSGEKSVWSTWATSLFLEHGTVERSRKCPWSNFSLARPVPLVLHLLDPSHSSFVLNKVQTNSRQSWRCSPVM